MNTNERVTLTIRNLDDLSTYRPRSDVLYELLKKKLTNGEEIKISLSKNDIISRGRRIGLQSRDDSDAGFNYNE